MPTRQIAIAARENRRAHHGMVSTLSTLMPELKRCSRDVTFLAQPGRDEVTANFSPPTLEMAPKHTLGRLPAARMLGFVASAF